MNVRERKAQALFDKALDYMSNRITNDDLERGELKVILEFLDKQGVNCVGKSNTKVNNIVGKLPVSLAVDNARG